MSRRSAFKMNFFISTFSLLAVLLLGAVVLVHKYPWPIFHSDISMAKDTSFLANWPLPTIEEDKQERKKLRRFPKSEQQRRLGIVMRRMDYLNVPIFDFFMDQGVQFLTPELTVGTLPSVPMIWPSLPSRRKIGSDDSSFQDVRYVVLPTPFGSQCVEGVEMSAGDEIRVSLPAVKNKRNVAFSVLPLAPSQLRAWMGQFSWARQFNDSDVNRIQTITIPVNDPAASSLRLSVGSGSVLLTSGTIAQWERSGRLPIQVGAQSTIWRSADQKVIEDVGDVAKYPTTVSNSEPNDEKNFVDGVSADKASNAKMTESSESSQRKKDTGKSAPAMDDLLDPESVKYNSVMKVPGVKSVALGYNAVLIQLDPMFSEYFEEPSLFAALAPRLHSYLGQSVNVPVSLPDVAGAELFQHTIVRQNGELIPVDLPILTKALISGNGVFNLYREFRNYGYKIASFAPSHALSFPAALSRGHEIPKVEGRWLDSNDWKFVARRKELDQQNEPVTGLEAIFKNEQSVSVKSMAENEFRKMAELLEGLERSSDAIPDWKANEIAIINDQNQYLPRLVDSFQRWIKENSQTRFFAHVYLNNEDSSIRPTFKDFLQVLKFKKLSVFTSPSEAEKLSKIVMVDRVFGHLVDTLIARRTFHRTVVGVVLPSRHKEKVGSKGRFIFSVPGLKAVSKNLKKEIRFDDVLATLGQTVGVQLNQVDSSGRNVFSGIALEHEVLPSVSVSEQDDENLVEAKKTVDISTKNVAKHEGSDSTKKAEGRVGDFSSASEPSESDAALTAETPAKQVSRFRLIVLPRASGCEPFEWNAATPYFGLESSQPIIEEPSPRGKVIRVFPCGLRDQVIELSWFQSHLGPQQTALTAHNSNEWLGGRFRVNLNVRGNDSGDTPLFLVGPKALPFDSLPMRLQSYSPHEIPLLFDVGARERVGRETLARVLNLSSQIQSPHMAARTLVYFFREPVRR